MAVRVAGQTLVLLAGTILSASAAVHADGGRLDRDFSDWRAASARDALPRAADPTYREACGGCHLAYQPGLLSAASWERLLGGLSSHFGENAELAPRELAGVRNYLLNNAAGRAPNRVSERFIRSVGPGPAPMRISETPYFIHEHRSLPTAAVSADPAVRTFANCGACHSRADEGSYDESTLRLPAAFQPQRD